MMWMDGRKGGGVRNTNGTRRSCAGRSKERRRPQHRHGRPRRQALEGNVSTTFLTVISNRAKRAFSVNMEIFTLLLP